MNIGIDARLLERKITGIGRFLILILNELPAIDKKNNYFLFSYKSLNINNDFYTNIPTVKSILPQKIFSPIWNNIILPLYLKNNKIDLFFSANQIIPLKKIKKCKYISVVHDVIYKADTRFLPVMYRTYLKIFTHFSIKKSDLILTVSHYSKQDILKNYNVDNAKVKVVHASANKNFFPMNLSEIEKKEIRDSYNSAEHIILYVGVIENRKNISGILKIADEVYEKNKKIVFLLVGKIGYGGKKTLREIHKRNNVVHIEGLEDQELQKLYNTASIFLFPSLYEGFGFPPLEAMQSGLPVLASNNTSLKEIIESGGILHDPDDYMSFTEDIFKLLEDEDLYKTMRNKGIERAKKFNLSNTVNKLVDHFNSFDNSF